MRISREVSFKSILFSLLTLFVVLVSLYVYVVVMPHGIYDDTVCGYIAHAGGAINGHKYTNSLEAFQNSLNNGIKFIELDMGITPDSALVAVHDWEKYKQMTGVSAVPKDAEDFHNHKLYGVYTPLIATQVDSIVNCNGCYLVLDKVSRVEMIEPCFGNIRDRILIECFSFEDYSSFKQLGYYLPMMSGKASAFVQLKYFCQSFIYGKEDHFINCFVMSRDDYDSGRKSAHPLKRLANTSYAIYNYETTLEADGIMNSDKNVRFVYVDNVSDKS